jgi:hypothetical protein
VKKRQHKRIPKRLPVKFGVSEPDIIGFTSDLSPVGMFIRTNRGLPPKTLINIALEIPSGEIIPLKGVVKRAVKYSSHLGGIMKNGMGIEIEGINEGYLQFVKGYYE